MVNNSKLFELTVALIAKRWMLRDPFVILRLGSIHALLLISRDIRFQVYFAPVHQL